MPLDGNSFISRESNLLPATFNPGSRGAVGESPSENLFDHVNRPVGANLPAADGEHAVQEGILRFGSLEARRRAKVGSSWRAVVTDALEGHVDESAVVSLQRDAKVELDDSIRAFDRPVAAPRQHLAAKPVTLERASGDRKRDAPAARSRTDVLLGCRLQAKHQQGTRVHGNRGLRGAR